MNEIALLIFEHVWKFVIGLVGVYALMTRARILIDFVPYEWVQIRNPERWVYFLAGGLYFWAGYQMFEERGTIPSDFIALTAGAGVGLAYYWVVILPKMKLADEHESMITFGDSWKK